MDSSKAWLQEVYEDLGSVLEHPEAVGISQPAPELFVKTVMAMRDKLKRAMVELSQNGSDGDISTELSEDAA